MESELVRLSSFKTWNFQLSNKLNPSQLARLGYYVEEGNIRCMNCAVAVLAIDTDDMNSFVRRHQNASPTCSPEIANVSVNSPLLSPCDLITSFEAKLANSNHSANSTESSTWENDSDDHHVSTVHHNLNVHDTKKLFEILKNTFQRAQNRGLFGRDSATFRKDFDRKNPDYTALQNEMARLQTFYDWPPGVPAKPDVLAKAGFFYAGEIDIVRCAFCKGSLRNWMPEDVPIEEHRKHFPDCSFVKHAENSNILGKIQVPKSLVPAQRKSPAATSQGNEGWNHSTQPPRHPHMADESKRVKSFTGKIVPRGQDVKILANAGFFYVGPQEIVECFCCGIGIKNWEHSNDPWCEHAHAYPQCKYLQAQKNPDIIRDIQKFYRQTQTSRNSAQGLSSNVQIGNNQSVANNDSAVTYHIEEDTATVQAVFDMGYSRQLVGQVIQKQLVETGDNFSNRDSFVEAVIEEQDRLDRANKQGLLPQNNDPQVLEEKLICIICRDAEKDTVFLPCGHLVCCSTCSPKLRICPICRTMISQKVRTFLS